MTYPGTKDINLLELLLTSMKGGSKYPFELNYLVGTLAGFINPSDKRVVSYSEEQLSPTVTADLKELYNTINAGRSWRGVPVVIAISNAKGEPLSELVMPAARERLLQNYPLVGTTLGSVNKPFGTKDECIIIGNYDHEALMKELRSGLNPALRLNYDIPNGFITRALYDISEAAVRDIGQKYELYGKNFYVARSSSDGFKVQTNFYFSETAKPNEVVKREFTFKCASTDPTLGTAPYEVKAQVIQGEDQPKLINNITNKVVGFSTKLMDELQAAGGESEMMKNFSAAVDDALTHGVTSMYSGGRQLQFSEMDGSVMVQDPMNNEATMVAPNPMDPNNMQLQPAQMPMGGAPAGGAMPIGQPMMQPVLDPNTGQPVIDPNTGQPMMQPMIDPNTGQPMMQPMVDPATGMPMGAGTPMNPAMMAQGGMAPQAAAMPAASPQVGAYNFAPGANSLQATDQGAVTGTFSDTTNVMEKLFSEGEYGNAYRKDFSEAIDRAFSEGSTVMYDEGTQINFANVNGEVFVEDTLRNELTRIAPKMYSENTMEAFPMKTQGSGNINNEMTDKTYFMQRVFSGKDPSFEQNIGRAIFAAAEKGQSSYKDGYMSLRFYSDGDVAVAEDEDTGERTAITVDEQGKIALSPMDGSGSDDSADGGYGVGEYPADDITNNIDNGDAMNPDVYVPIDTGIEDGDLAGLLGDPSESFGDSYEGAPEGVAGDFGEEAGEEDEEGGDEYEGGGDEEGEEAGEEEGDEEDDDEDAKTFSQLTGGLDWRMFSENELMQLANASGIPSDEGDRVELPFDDIAGNLEDGDSMNPDVYVPINTGIEDGDLAGLMGDPSESFKDGGSSEGEAAAEEVEAEEMGDPETAVFSCKGEDGKTYHFSEEDMIGAVTDNANEMMEKVKELEETKDKKLAEDVAEKAKSVKEQAELLAEATDTDVEDVRNQSMKAFSFAHEVYNGKYDSIQEGIAVASSTQKASPRTSFQNLLFSETPAGADAPVMSLDAPVAPIPTEPSIEAQIANPVAEEGEPGVVIENITVNGDMNVGGGAEDEAGIAPAEPRNFSDVKMYSDVQPGVEGGTSFSKLLFGQY